MSCPDCLDCGVVRAIKPGERDALCQCVTRVHDDVVMPARANPAEILALLGLPQELVDRVRKTAAEPAFQRGPVPMKDETCGIGALAQQRCFGGGPNTITIIHGPQVPPAISKYDGFSLPKNITEFVVVTEDDGSMMVRMNGEDFGDLRTSGVSMACRLIAYGAGEGKVRECLRKYNAGTKIRNAQARAHQQNEVALRSQGFTTEDIEEAAADVAAQIASLTYETRGDVADIVARAMCKLVVRKFVREFPGMGGYINNPFGKKKNRVMLSYTPETAFGVMPGSAEMTPPLSTGGAITGRLGSDTPPETCKFVFHDKNCVDFAGFPSIPGQPEDRAWRFGCRSLGGKTALLKEMADRARERGDKVLEFGVDYAKVEGTIMAHFPQKEDEKVAIIADESHRLPKGSNTSTTSGWEQLRASLEELRTREPHP